MGMSLGDIMLLSDKTYDFLKWLAIFFLPALGTFVGIVGVALKWEPTAVAETIIFAAGGFVASCIKMSTKAYEQAKREQYEGTE